MIKLLRTIGVSSVILMLSVGIAYFLLVMSITYYVFIIIPLFLIIPLLIFVLVVLSRYPARKRAKNARLVDVADLVEGQYIGFGYRSFLSYRITGFLLQVIEHEYEWELVVQSKNKVKSHYYVKSHAYPVKIEVVPGKGIR